MLRDCSEMNPNGNIALLIVFCIMGWFYYVAYYICWFIKEPSLKNIFFYFFFFFVVEKSSLFIAFSILFNVFFIMLFWSLLTSIFMDPGRIP